MGDEVLTRAAALVSVALAGEREGALDLGRIHLPGAVDAVLSDHGEQVAEQRALVRGERLGAIGQQSARLARVLLGADARMARMRPSGALSAVSTAPSPRVRRTGLIAPERLLRPSRSGSALGAVSVA
jgi:hypothetical protein